MSNKYPIKRVKNSNNKDFRYLWKDGKSVKEQNTLQRIRKLRIPPAYSNVKIYSSNAKIQATGFDDKKRKQYRYHPSWVEERNRKKFRGLIAFSEAYPKIIKKINNLLGGKSPSSKLEMVALAIGVLNVCRIRPGSAKHLRDTGSFGTTTLLRAHVTEKKCPQSSSPCLFIHFRGKSGVDNFCKINAKTVVGKSLKALLKKRKNPHELLFQYDHSLVKPGDINKFLKNTGGRNVTAKAFRTYHANARIINFLKKTFPEASQISMTKRKKLFNDIVKKLAEELHHTPATFKNSYLFPPLKDLFIDDPLKFKTTFLKKETDGALSKFIHKKTSKSPKTPKAWR
jgi:DNA topoisomerase-1